MMKKAHTITNEQSVMYASDVNLHSTNLHYFQFLQHYIRHKMSYFLSTRDNAIYKAVNACTVKY